MTDETLPPAAAFAAVRIREGDRRDAIKEQLLAVGWSDEEADAAYAQGCVACGVPVREGGEAGAAARFATVQAVVNFFSFVLLGFIVYGLFALFFGIITLAFPDTTLDSTYYANDAQDGIRYATAALIIALPLYWLALRMWFARFRSNPTAHESRVTKFLTYLVLLAAAIVIVGDMVAVIYTFLDGDLTVRFLLKALTVVAIAGGTFGFYYLERREVQYRRQVGQQTFRLFGAAVIAVTVLGIIMGFVLGGSPVTARAQATDQQRAQNLESTASCIDNFVSAYRRLPANLAEVKTSNTGCYGTMADPETGTPFDYRPSTMVMNPTTMVLEGDYDLCATFATDTTATANTTETYLLPWSEHPAGRACDTRTVSVSPTVGL